MIEVLVIASAVIVGVFSTARLARLITQDTFPPSVWLRMKWDKLTDDGQWSDLMHCPFCITPYLALPILLWGWLGGLDIVWWVFNGWMAASYAAAMVVMRDGE